MKPGYEQKGIDPAELNGKMRLIASPDGRDGSETIQQNANVYAAHLNGDEVTQSLAPGRRAWLQVARGTASINGVTLSAGDGAGLQDEPTLLLAAKASAEVLFFDLP